MKTMVANLPIPEARAYTLDPKDSALVVVDMENEFLKKEGKRYLGERGDKIIPYVAALIKKFREAGSKIIYVQSVRKPDALEFTVFKKDPILLENTWAVEIVDELAPLPGEPIVQKSSHDCFNNTNMEEVIESLGLVSARSQIVVTGVATNVCVDCAFTGFRVRDFRVYLPKDCTASNTYEAEVAAYQHLIGRQYNTYCTRSDLINFS